MTSQTVVACLQPCWFVITPSYFRLLMGNSATNHIMWTWCVTFGKNVVKPWTYLWFADMIFWRLSCKYSESYWEPIKTWVNVYLSSWQPCWWACGPTPSAAPAASAEPCCCCWRLSAASLKRRWPPSESWRQTERRTFTPAEPLSPDLRLHTSRLWLFLFTSASWD